MKWFGWGIYLLVSLIFLVYLAVPGPQFPPQLPDSRRSTEPGDNETQFRQAYYTDMNREEVMEYYSKAYALEVFGLKIPNYRLNYPPEESGALIRDQTRSTFLEEIVYPFRESLFVNGFLPPTDKTRIFFGKKEYLQKIIVKQAPSNVYTRLAVGVATLAVIPFVFREIKQVFVSLTQ